MNPKGFNENPSSPKRWRSAMVFVGLQETIQVHNAPASLMPSCRICPSGAYAKGSDQTLPPSHIEQIHWYSSECIDFIQNGPLSTILPYRLTNCLIYFDSELHVILCHIHGNWGQIQCIWSREHIWIYLGRFDMDYVLVSKKGWVSNNIMDKIPKGWGGRLPPLLPLSLAAAAGAWRPWRPASVRWDVHGTS